ncbi:unnamed protein product, partial [Nesidiocoris tenuis]
AVGVHCRLGKGRSGVMAACYLVRFFDQLPEVAVTNIRLLQPGAIETLGQERSVREYYEYIRDEEPEKIDEVDRWIRAIPRPYWDHKPRPRIPIWEYNY